MSRLLICGLIVLTAFAQDYRTAPKTDWPLVGGDWGNTRYSTLDKINVSNVKTLKGAWMARLQSGFGAGFSQQGTPVVKDGVMYITTGEQEIFALDAKTGNQIWAYRTPTDPKTGDNKAKRGVALGEGMVFGVESDIRQPAPKEGRPEPLTRMFALDQKTGKTLWKVELGADVPKELRQYVAVPPLYYKGLVYVSISGGDGGLRGRLAAHDAKTGKEVWRWWAVPGPGEFGHDTWEGDSWEKGGGAIWVQPALDPELGIVYVSTGNPWPDTDGTKRGGDNLFSASIVALDLKTGVRKWHFQEVHHDLWDYDGPASPVLADISYQGRSRKILMHGSKTG